MKFKMNKLGLLLIGMFLFSCTIEGQVIESPQLNDAVYVKTEIFEVWYNEVYEQPMKLVYKSENRPTNVNRGSMDFWVPKGVHTSDSKDYYRNIYDKGHLAPAATFSDNMENLKATFSYLNCALQDQYMNRGEWRLLEEQERKWDDEGNLVITIELVFDEGHIVLPTGGHIPTDMIKHIYFEKTGSWRCFEFDNVKPTKGWEEHEVKHTHN
jgi:DNA/RNA endonuclease G (NUC1)